MPADAEALDSFGCSPKVRRQMQAALDDQSAQIEAAWLAAAARGEREGMLSVHLFGGSRPGTHDVAFVARADYLSPLPGATREERGEEARILAQIDATDFGSTFW